MPITLQVDTVLEGCAFFLEQSAYHVIQPTQLSAHLQAAGMIQSHARAFAGVWEAESAGVLQRLRALTLGAHPTLESVDWRLHVQVCPNLVFPTCEQQCGRALANPVHPSHFCSSVLWRVIGSIACVYRRLTGPFLGCVSWSDLSGDSDGIIRDDESGGSPGDHEFKAEKARRRVRGVMKRA